MTEKLWESTGSEFDPRESEFEEPNPNLYTTIFTHIFCMINYNQKKIIYR